MGILLLCIGALLVAASGCGTETADVERGRLLFITKCGTCHALAQAGTKANQGPDLDAAFAAGREVGQDSDTVEGVVESQIDDPTSAYLRDSPVVMPPDIVSGQDRADIAAYVARWAGVPGAEPPRVPGGPGAQAFVAFGCGGCHALAAAEAGGRTGPDLDEVIPGDSKAVIREEIVEPDKRIAPGFAAGIMPNNFEQIIPAPELDALVDYLAAEAGKGKAAG